MSFNISNTIDEIIKTGILKKERIPEKTFVLSILAGVFIALGAYSSLLVRIDTPVGIAKILAGIVFSTGLIMITLTGAELFTGNILMTLNFFKKEISPLRLLKNWLIVYFGNMIGAIVIVFIVIFSAEHSKTTLDLIYQTAEYKINLSVLNCFLSGILCNLLVCMAVYMAQCAKTAPGKIAGIILPITVFIIAGYEHSIANMFFIPAGMVVSNLYGSCLPITGIDFLYNIIPTTLGNIFGAIIFVSAPLWVCYKK